MNHSHASAKLSDAEVEALAREALALNTGHDMPIRKAAKQVATKAGISGTKLTSWLTRHGIAHKLVTVRSVSKYDRTAGSTARERGGKVAA